MIANYLKVVLRTLTRQKAFAFINIFGLTIGLAGFILIMLFVRYELNYDRSNTNLDRMYMVVRDVYLDNNVYNFTPVPFPFRDEIVSEFPEIEKATRMDWWNRFLVRHEDKVFDEPVVLADAEYFDMFTLDVIRGNADKPMPDNNSVVISRKIAEKYFGNDEPVGKVFQVNGSYDFVVSGVFENHPPNTTFKFDIILPFDFHRKLGKDFSNWGMNSVNVFIMLNPGTDVDAFQKKLEPKLAQHQPSDQPDKLFLHPLKDFHLYNFHYKGGAIQFVYLFSIIGIVILALAGINYVNLVTARSVRRAKEIGIRKTVGAGRTQVIVQFLGESILLALVSLNFAVILVELLLPVVNPVIGAELTLTYTAPGTLLSLVGIAVITGVVAGLYPAFYLSGFNPSSVLKSIQVSGKGTFKSALVIVQFSVSIALIITSIFLYKQLTYMRSLPTGLNMDNVLYFKLEDEAKRNLDVLKTALAEVPGVSEVATASHLPTEIFSNGGGFSWEGKDPSQDVLISSTSVNDGYLETFDIELKQGRYFEPGEVAVDTVNNIIKVLINERMAEILAFADPIGKSFQGGDWRFEIIGVVTDFNFLRMRSEMGPLMMFYSPENGQFGFVKMSGDADEVKKLVESKYRELFPQLPPDFRSYEAYYNNYFGTETKNARIFGYFTLLAILISCLGLYGLASYIAEQRRKEMGIRKALGANTSGLSMLMLKDFAIWILVSNLIAVQIAWYYSSDLLSRYAFRTSLSPWVFVIAAFVSVFVAAVTVIFQIRKTAAQSPAVVLKYE